MRRECPKRYMHEEFDLDAVSGWHGDFHLPRITSYG